MNTAIILAGGKGTRMNAGINKAYLPLRDKPILAHTIEVFNKHKLIDEIILVHGDNEEELCKHKVLSKASATKVKKIVTGGKERQNSVYNGLINVCDDCDIVLIHDGARPFVSANVIQKCIEGAISYGAVTSAVPVKETIKVVKQGNIVDHTPNRKDLWVTQTPQAFQRDIIIKAHLEAVKNNLIGTDDAMLVERLGYQVRIIEGEYENIKITTPDDLIIAEGIMNFRRK